MDPEEREAWRWSIPGETAYDKLLQDLSLRRSSREEARSGGMRRLARQSKVVRHEG